MPGNNPEVVDSFAACIDAGAARTGCKSVDYNADTRQCVFLRGNYVRCHYSGMVGCSEQQLPTRGSRHGDADMCLRIQIPKIEAASGPAYHNARMAEPPVSAQTGGQTGGGQASGGQTGGGQAGGGQAGGGQTSGGQTGNQSGGGQNGGGTGSGGGDGGGGGNIQVPITVPPGQGQYTYTTNPECPRDNGKAFVTSEGACASVVLCFISAVNGEAVD